MPNCIHNANCACCCAVDGGVHAHRGVSGAESRCKVSDSLFNAVLQYPIVASACALVYNVAKVVYFQVRDRDSGMTSGVCLTAARCGVDLRITQAPCGGEGVTGNAARGCWSVMLGCPDAATRCTWQHPPWSDTQRICGTRALFAAAAGRCRRCWPDRRLSHIPITLRAGSSERILNPGIVPGLQGYSTGNPANRNRGAFSYIALLTLYALVR